jgi:DNA-binding NtrC family response regulator
MSPPASKGPVRILHLEDSPRDRELVQDALEMEGFDCEIHHVETREQFVAAMAGNEVDLVVSDHSLPSFDGSTALQLTREQWPETPFIFLTGSLGDESAVEKMKNGATDYVLKHRIERLAPAIRRALGETTERRRRERAEVQVRQSDELFRQISENIQDLIAILDPDGKRV